MSTTVSETASPWHAAYPNPRTAQPAVLTRDAVLAMIKTEPDTASKSFVLVDLRRADHNGGTIQGSINLPAQSLYPAIPTLYKLFKSAGVNKVIWYCSSSRGRGTRAAGWFTDYLEDQGDDTILSLVLLDGIRGWVTGGADYVAYVDEYDPDVWSEN